MIQETRLNKAEELKNTQKNIIQYYTVARKISQEEKILFKRNAQLFQLVFMSEDASGRDLLKRATTNCLPLEET